MGDMREIVSVKAVQSLFLLLAVVLPLAGLAIGGLMGAQRGSAPRGAMRGLLAGLLGPLNLALWTLYNALTERNGLDTVRNVAVNFTVFVVIGLALGIGLALWQRPVAAGETISGETNPSEQPTNTASD